MTSPPVRWRAGIVDDEPPARRSLTLLVGAAPDFVVAAECGNGAEALVAIAREHPDVLFLDVRMPGLDGFELLRRVPAAQLPAAVVFVTAYDEYALAAFERHAVDYLLKPFSDERFADVLDHVRVRLRERHRAAITDRLEAVLADVARAERPLVLRDGQRTHVIPYDEIVWIEAEDYCVRVHARDRQILARESLRTLEAALPSARFVRVHRSAIVNLRCITAIEPVVSGDQRLVLADGTTLRVSRTHRAALLDALGR